ncbi:MAG: endonuclease III [Desulfovibrionales bacterium]|nr:endonuclease III [Desulfovibrionales bacterium]
MRKKERALEMLARLHKRYPVKGTHLTFSTVWELFVATVLSAQCTDERVNKVTPVLFERWPTPEDLAQADVLDVESVVRSTGFYRNKAKNIVAAAKRVVDVYDGEVPRTLKDITSLAGAARKTASVVLWNGYRINEGIAIDTHVKRIVFRMGLTTSTNPTVVEKDLLPLFPRDEWGFVNHMLVSFGRDVCNARSPLCDQCEMAEFCPRKGVKRS